MKAVTGPLPHGPRWQFEPKWDGHRALVATGPGGYRAASSSGRSRTDAWRWIGEALEGRSAPDLVLDGEVIAMGPNGTHAFQLVGRADAEHAYVVFDLLAADGIDLTTAVWSERRARLCDAVERGPHIIVTPTTSDGDTLHAVTVAQGLEGVIAKRVDSPYLPGRRSPAWVKTKHRSEQEFVIGGFLPGSGRRSRLGSLLLGVQDARPEPNAGQPGQPTGQHTGPGGALRFVGAAGSGLAESDLASIVAQLDQRRTDVCPFRPVPDVPAARARWVRPELVAQIRFGGWTDRGRLRHPVVLGLRDDVDPSTVVRET